MALAQREDLRQRIDGADRGRAERRDDGADAARLQARARAPRRPCGRARRRRRLRNGMPSTRADAASACSAPAPEAATAVPGRSSRAIHSASRFAIVPPLVRWPRCASQPNMRAISATASFSIARAGAAAVERVVVGIDPHRERVGEARDRMRRLQHLARRRADGSTGSCRACARPPRAAPCAAPPGRPAGHPAPAAARSLPPCARARRSTTAASRHRAGRACGRNRITWRPQRGAGRSEGFTHRARRCFGRRGRAA